MRCSRWRSSRGSCTVSSSARRSSMASAVADNAASKRCEGGVIEEARYLMQRLRDRRRRPSAGVRTVQLGTQINHRVAHFKHREQPAQCVALQIFAACRERVDLRKQIARTAFKAHREPCQAALARRHHLPPQFAQQQTAQPRRVGGQQHGKCHRTDEHGNDQRDGVVDEAGRIVLNDVVGAGEKAEEDAISRRQ